MTQNGKFVWHEMMTTNMEASIKYYTELLGWQVMEVDMAPMGKFNMIKAGEKNIGGFVPLPADKGMPPFWVGYVSVEDVDQAVETAKGLGGQVGMGPMDIPNVGRFAIVMDPQGAALAVFKGAQGEMAGECCRQPKAGEFCWDELVTPEPEKAKGFYGKMVGWSYKLMDMGEMGQYHVAQAGGTDMAGVMMTPPGVQAPPSWMHYIFVEDLEGQTKRAGELGGKVLMDIMDIPGVGRFSVIQDPVGGVFCLFGMAKTCGCGCSHS